MISYFSCSAKASRLIELEHDARRKGKENVLVKVLVGSKRGDGLHARTSEGAPSSSTSQS